MATKKASATRASSSAKTASKKSVVKKASTETPSAKNAGAKKTPAKKIAAKKAPAKKTAAKNSDRKYSPAASKQVGQELHEMDRGQLKIGRSNKKVTNPKQAIAIGLSEARRAGKKVPPNPNDPKKK